MSTGRGCRVGKLVLTPKEAAEVLGVSRTTLARWADSGLLRVFRTEGGHRRFYGVQVQALRDGYRDGALP